MKKLLILQNRIKDYRADIYKELNKEYDVTVIHTGNKVNLSFKEIKLRLIKFGPFNLLRNFQSTIYKIKPDYIIAMFDLHWPQFYFCLPKYSKNVFWGLDKSKNYFFNLVKKLLINFLGKSVLFYSKTTQRYWLKKIKVQSFVAQNTVKVGIAKFSKPRRHFINVGSLNYRKRNDITLKAFSKLDLNIKKKTKIIFVGEGSDKKRLKQIAKKLNIEKNVIFKGYIKDKNQLSEIYSTAISSISVGQAGLSVSQSLGYGVPFITHFNAISGGELYGIQRANGYKLKTEIDNPKCIDELTNTMYKFWKKRYKKNIYLNCKKYYDLNLSVRSMVNSMNKSLN